MNSVAALKCSGGSAWSALLLLLAISATVLTQHNVAHAQDEGPASCDENQFFNATSNECSPMTLCNSQCSATTGLSAYGPCTCPALCLVCNFEFGSPSRAECTLCGNGRSLHQGSCVNACPDGHISVGSGTVGRVCEPEPGSGDTSGDGFGDDTPAWRVHLQFQETEPTATSDRVCKAATVCSRIGMFEDSPATTTTDTVCLPLTNCTAMNGYISKVSDGFSDHICSPLTACEEGAAYEIQAPTATSDRVCRPLSAPCHLADADMYETQAPTGTSDRTCSLLTTCDLGPEFISLAATPTSDRYCNTTTTCATESGEEYVAVEVTPTSDRRCAAVLQCDLYTTYEAARPTATSNRACKQCTDCSAQEGHYQEAPCTLTSDAECEPCTACADGTFAVRPCLFATDTLCVACTRCVEGRDYETSPCTQSSNRRCTACSSCEDGTFQSQACTVASDIMCTPLTECGAHEFETQPPTATSDRACQRWTRCRTNEFESVPPTATTDRVCTHFSTCDTGTNEEGGLLEFESVPPTATTDRQCRACRQCSSAESLYIQQACTRTTDTMCGQVASCTQRCARDTTADVCVESGTTVPCTLYSTKDACPSPRCEWLPDLVLPCQLRVDAIQPGTDGSSCPALPQYACAGVCVWDLTTHTCRKRTCEDIPSRSQCQSFAHEECEYDDVVFVCKRKGTDTPCSRVLPSLCETLDHCSLDPVTSTCHARSESVACMHHSQATCPLYRCFFDDASNTCWPRRQNVPCSRYSADTCPVQGTEYQAAAATTTSDVTCSRITACAERDEYQVAPATATSDRDCRSVTVCDPLTEFQLMANTATSDRVCANVTQCTSAEYQSSAPTATTDAACARLTTCTRGNYTFPRLPSASDAIGDDSSGDPGEDEDDPVPSGRGFEFELITPTTSTDRVCVPATTCDVGQFVVSLPTGTSDAECEAISACRAGLEFETNAPTPSSDRECESLSECDGIVTYKTAAPTPTSDRVCSTTTACSSSAYQLTPSSRTADRACAPLTACRQTEFVAQRATPAPPQLRRLGLATYISDHTCQPHSACDNATEYAAVAATPTSDVVCLPLRMCVAPLIEVVPPTPTSDRVCDGEVAVDASLYLVGIDLPAFPVSTFPDTMAEVVQRETGATLDASKVFITRLRDGSVDVAYRVLAPTSVAENITALLRDDDAVLAQLKAVYPSLQNATAEALQCPDGQFVSDTGEGTGLSVPGCVAVSACGVDEFEAEAPTPTSDRECASITPSCPEPDREYISQFATATSDIVCSPLDVCLQAVEYEAEAPTTTSNRVCSLATVCGPVDQQFEEVPLTATSDRVCSNVTSCPLDDGLFTAVTATKTSDAACSPVRVCDAMMEYEAVHPTPSSDRVCSNLTRCEPWVEYETLAPTPTSDRRCAAVSPPCHPSLQYQVTPQSPTSDRECSNITSCALDQFAVVHATATTDRECQDLRVCRDDEFQTVAPTQTSDRRCEKIRACKQEEYLVARATATTDTMCSYCDMCGDDEFETTPCTLATNRICKPLAVCSPLNGTFEAVAPTQTSDRMCAQCSTCPSEHHTTRACTQTADTVCKGCRTCTLLSQFEIAPCTVSSDRVCAACSECPTGSFQREPCFGMSDAVCEPCTPCDQATQYQVVPCRAQADAVCANITACTADEYMIRGPTATTDRECRRLRVCRSSEFERVAPTSTTDRVCLSIEQCTLDTEYEEAPPTATSNAVCAPRTPACPDSSFLVRAGTPTSDIVCQPHRVCQPELQFETAPATATSNRACADAARCQLNSDGTGTFETSPLTATTDRVCEDVRTCDMGSNEYLSVPATATSNALCATATSCVPRASYETRPLTATSDRECTPVRAPCSLTTQYETAPPTLTSDRVCARLTECEPNEFVSRERTSVNDRECRRYATCAAFNAPLSDMCEACYLPQTPNNASVSACRSRALKFCQQLTEREDGSSLPEYCVPCSRSTSTCFELAFQYAQRRCVQAHGQFMATAPTATSDRQCSNITSCARGQFTSTLPTPTSDRRCSDGVPLVAITTTTAPPTAQGSTAGSTQAAWVFVVVGILILGVLCVVVAGIIVRRGATSGSHDLNTMRLEDGGVQPVRRSTITSTDVDLLFVDPSARAREKAVREEGELGSGLNEPYLEPAMVALGERTLAEDEVRQGAWQRELAEMEERQRAFERQAMQQTQEQQQHHQHQQQQDQEEEQGRQRSTSQRPSRASLAETVPLGPVKKGTRNQKVGVVKRKRKSRQSARAVAGKDATLQDIYDSVDNNNKEAHTKEQAAATASSPASLATAAPATGTGRASSQKQNADDVLFGTKQPSSSSSSSQLASGAQLESLKQGLEACEEEYTDICKLDREGSTTAATRQHSMRRNRYRNVLAIDATRVVLAEDDEGDDYINASHVRIPHTPPLHYIVSQGPTEQTLAQTWAMVVQEDIHVIVMVTNLVEPRPDGTLKRKAHPYWPQQKDKAMVCGHFIITCVETKEERGYTEATLVVRSSRDQTLKHTVTHVQYRDWPDFGIADPHSLLHFVETTRRHRHESEPVLVHCSAGLGRSGVFMLVDACLRKMEKGLVPDPKALLVHARTQRPGLVQTAEQYRLIYQCLLAHVGKARDAAA